MSLLGQGKGRNVVRSDEQEVQTDKSKNPNWRKENDNLSCYALSKYSNEPEDDFDYFDLNASLKQIQKNTVIAKTQIPIPVIPCHLFWDVAKVELK